MVDLMNYLRNKRFKIIDDYIGLFNKKKILDLGCGNKELKTYLLNNSENIEFDYEGLDLSNGWDLDDHNERLKDKILWADVIVCFATLEHLKRPYDFVKLLSENTKKGALIFLTFPGPQSDLLLRIMSFFGMVSHEHIFDHKTYPVKHHVISWFMEHSKNHVILLKNQTFQLGNNNRIILMKMRNCKS